jgi:hypothetical protein
MSEETQTSDVIFGGYLHELPNVADMTKALVNHGQKLEDATKELTVHSKAYGNAVHAYRMAKARAHLAAEEALLAQGFKKPTVDQKAAYVDLQAANEMKAAKEAEAMMLAYREIAKGYRGILSAWQSITGAFRDELNFVRTGPRT